MVADRKLWKRALKKYHAPPWPCPSCAKGTMRLVKKSLIYEETAASKHQVRDEDFNPYEVKFVFTAMLNCSLCNEKVSCCGDGGMELEQLFDGEGHSYADYEPLFFVKYFSKPMLIFAPPRQCPEKVRNCVLNSFTVFFCDINAAANHVRQCIEEILTHAGISNKNRNGNFVNLGNRIKEFELTDSENAARVDALRWIGNFGSHPESLVSGGVFDAYDILEVLLEDLYIGHQKSVRDLVARITKTRKPM